MMPAPSRPSCARARAQLFSRVSPMRSAIASTFVVSLLAVASVALVVRAQVPSTTPPSGLRENTPTAHAFTNAKIVAAPGRVIDKGMLVIRDGVIVAVGAADEVKPPADAKVWDLTGKTIYPGLI